MPRPSHAQAITLSTLILLFFSARGSAADLEIFTHSLSMSTGVYSLWTAPPSRRVFKNDSAPVATSGTIQVYAAKNEFEPFQLVVKPAASGNVTVSIGNFGSGITTEIFQVKYVNIAQATDNLGSTGPYPDPLWPIANGGTVALTAGNNTSFWFSISVPQTAPAGTYTTNATVAGITIADQPACL